jgi:tetratricopeptide (TPR) repeat protein
MKLNRIFFFLLLLVSRIVHAGDDKTIFDSGNSYYSKGDYKTAIKEYETILVSGSESAELYYNLGNAYFKTNNLGYSILNYERAKKLKPDDEDISANLNLAEQKTEDKIEAAPQLFLSQWENGLSDLMTEKQWSELLIGSIILGLALIAIYILSANKILKQLGFFGGLALLIFSIFSFFMAKNKFNSEVNNSSAIIVVSSVNVTGSPSEKGTVLFLLHEGSKVKIMDQENEWTEVKIANGNVGWIKNSNLEKI